LIKVSLFTLGLAYQLNWQPSSPETMPSNDEESSISMKKASAQFLAQVKMTESPVIRIVMSITTDFSLMPRHHGARRIMLLTSAGIPEFTIYAHQA
jgi:hypothetical protein